MEQSPIGAKPAPERLVVVAVHLVAGLPFGDLVLVIFAGARLDYLGSILPIEGLPSAWVALGALPGLCVAVALAVALVPFLRRWGWLVAAAGAGVLRYAQAITHRLEFTYVLLIAVGVAIVLGGLLLAFAAARRRSRLALASGFTVGAMAWHTLPAVARGLPLAALVVGLVAFALTRFLTRAADAPAGASGRDWMLAGLIGVLGIGVDVADHLRDQRLGRLPEVTGPSVLIGRFTELLLVAAGLAVAAAWRAGPGAARWVVAGEGVAGSAIFMVGFPRIVALVTTPLAVVTVVAGALLALTLAEVADRWFPWDAVGVAALTIALATFDGTPAEVIPAGQQLSILLAVGAAAFTMVAGLARLAPAPRTGAATSFALGFAALVLVDQIGLGFGRFTHDTLSDRQAWSSLFGIACAVALTGLFLADRRRDRLGPARSTVARQPIG